MYDHAWLDGPGERLGRDKGPLVFELCLKVPPHSLQVAWLLCFPGAGSRPISAPAMASKQHHNPQPQYPVKERVLHALSSLYSSHSFLLADESARKAVDDAILLEQAETAARLAFQSLREARAAWRSATEVATLEKSADLRIPYESPSTAFSMCPRGEVRCNQLYSGEHRDFDEQPFSDNEQGVRAWEKAFDDLKQKIMEGATTGAARRAAKAGDMAGGRRRRPDGAKHLKMPIRQDSRDAGDWMERSRCLSPDGLIDHGAVKPPGAISPVRQPGYRSMSSRPVRHNGLVSGRARGSAGSGNHSDF